MTYYLNKKKGSWTKIKQMWPGKVCPENNSLPWSGASFMAIYPGLYIALLNSCYDNSVNRIRVTTEGFSGIVFFGENGSVNASFTKISWKSRAPFSGALYMIFSKIKDAGCGCSSYGATGHVSGIRKGRRNCQEGGRGDGTVWNGCQLTEGREESQGLITQTVLKNPAPYAFVLPIFSFSLFYITQYHSHFVGCNKTSFSMLHLWPITNCPTPMKNIT